MYTIIGKIDNFDRKKSYKGFERKSPVVETKVNKCVVSTTVRKKKVLDPNLVIAKKEFRATPNAKRKPKLVASTKLN